MENYSEVFKELKNYFSNNIKTFKKELNTRFESYEKSSDYFQKTLDKKIQNEIDNLKKFIKDEKELIDNLNKENSKLKLELELLKTSLTEDKKIIEKEIQNSLIQDISFIDTVAEKTIEKLGV